MSTPQPPLFHAEETPTPQPVTCLGLTFASDEARRAHFTEQLRQKLQDPAFRQIEGFPIGSDEDILALSDPPYYTACPNPWIADFVAEWEAQKPPKPAGYSYHREPFAADVSEGKNDPIYNAHSYHTKVPHKAIMRYILHYTEPGDIVFDGFCGTGMTGVAAQMCGDKTEIESLGYVIDKGGKIYDRTLMESSQFFSKLGIRQALLSDLSPLAAFVAHSYADLSLFKQFTDEALALLSSVEKELHWLYEGISGDKLLSAIWSDIFICPNCSGEIVFWEAAVENGAMLKSFACPHCRATVGKAASKADNAVKLERAFGNIFDPILQKIVQVPKHRIVSETAEAGKTRKTRRIGKDEEALLLSRFNGRQWPRVPEDAFFPGRQTNKLINGSGISYVCHMYTQRALFAYGYLWQQQLSSHKFTSLFRYCLTSINNYISRKQGYFGGGGGVSGTLFTPSLHLERNVFDVLRRKLKKLGKLAVELPRSVSVSTQSIADLRNQADETIDYIFTDPPFGESLQYAELNMFVEAWLRVKTDTAEDCVLNYVHEKDLTFYSNMMHRAFKEYARILKSGKWMTIEFHNSQNAVWSAIQQAIESSGLVVADVRILDKQQRSFNAVNRAGAVDQDLVISAYKPDYRLEKSFSLSAGTEDAAWDFIRTHLGQLPVCVTTKGKVEVNSERMNFLLFDRMVAFHVQRGVTVPLSAAEFYAGLEQRFMSRDGMYFLPDQVVEYDKKRLTTTGVEQLSLIISDESSAIQWLRQALKERPQTFQEIHPQFMRELGAWSKNEQTLELSTLLEQNFLSYDGKGPVPEQIHAYLSTNWKDLRNLAKDDAALVAKARDRWYVPDPNKAGDLERLRERSLLREFESYKESKKKLRVIRLEAVRAGFKRAWQARDYAAIIAVAERIPSNVLEEDPKLLMWYDQAVTRLGGSA